MAAITASSLPITAKLIIVELTKGLCIRQLITRNWHSTWLTTVLNHITKLNNTTSVVILNQTHRNGKAGR